MCRHICPIGNATGQERNNSRARALGLSLVARNAIDFSEDIIDNIYECSFCGACVKECVTGWDPVYFAKEARKIAALEGKLPKYVDKLLENHETTGNIYGLKKQKKILDAAKAAKMSDTLFFLGADATYKTPEAAIRAIELLQKSGESFMILENEPDSGYAFDFLIGEVDETKKLAEAAAKELNSFKKVICYDPNDAKMFLREYKEWGIEEKFEVITFTKYIASLIADKKLDIKKSGKVYTFNDPCTLARDLEETAYARDIINALGENREMLLFGKDTMLAGNLIMNEYMPDVMEKVAYDRWENAVNMDAEILVTASPADYYMLNKTKNKDIALITIEEAVLKCL